MSNNDNFEFSDAIKKSEILTGDIITLQRKTRPGTENVNGYIYTKGAFDEAMEFYRNYRGNGVYLAPVSVDNGKHDLFLRELNNRNYVRFHDPVNNDYLIGTIDSWDDYSISIKINPTELGNKFLKYITTETKVYMRYISLCQAIKGIPITRLSITSFDLPVIPFEELDMEIKKPKEKENLI